MKQPTVKNKKNGLKIAVASMLSAVTLAIGGAAAYQNVKLKDYADNQQINHIAAELNCDMSIFFKSNNNYLVMEHNGDEPIYVYLDETIKGRDVALAKQSLDYVFDIVGDINENYDYEIVDKSTFDSKIGKTKIEYGLGDVELKDVKLNGLAHHNPNILSYLTSKSTTNDYKITIRDYSIEEQDDESRLYIYIHELLHTFGFNDVYTLEKLQTTTKHYGNTIMNTEQGQVRTVITPDDLKILMSAYTKQMPEAELEQKIELYKQKIKEYENMYYDYYSKIVHEKSSIANKIENTNFKLDGEISTAYEDGRVLETYYEIDITDDKYHFVILNDKNKIIDSCDGEVLWKDGFAVLRNITLKHGIRPNIKNESYEGGYVQDWSIIDCGNHYELYDTFTNSGYWMYETELESELGV